ncbi:hypothetical protein AWB67_06678 [Caballeronia terrestris]|uniref:Uncharacterized protein n=1 Tax=Caballeronia terrestris TaxID=1226301 RepID=A0A158KTL9_9BURK|nr:hypothetical protein AWB67_06678 [Caballeronia terrestris]
MKSELVETGARRGADPGVGGSLVAKVRAGMLAVLRTRMQARMQRW